MSVESKKVLELVAEGKINPEEAEKLLEKLASLPGTGNGSEASLPESKTPDGKHLRYLRILVEKPGTKNINLRIPIGFLRLQSGLNVILPQRVLDKLSDSGIDFASFSRLRGQDLEAALQHLDIDVDQNNGKKVRIFCE